MFNYALVIGAIATIVFLILRIKMGGLAAATAKACASVSFIAVACAAVFDRLSDPSPIVINHTFNRWSLFVILGLVCGLLGDVWLDFKYAFIEKSDKFTFGGFAFFLAGHLLYLVAIYNTMSFSLISVYIAIALAAIFALFTVFGERKLGLKLGKFKAISAVYLAILAYFTVIAGGAAVQSSFAKGPVLMFVGALFFLISDFILSGTYFGENKNTKAYVLWNHIFYYAAQFLIASSLLFI